MCIFKFKTIFQFHCFAYSKYLLSKALSLCWLPQCSSSQQVAHLVDVAANQLFSVDLGWLAAAALLQ
jgi:hypothetical protein